MVKQLLHGAYEIVFKDEIIDIYNYTNTKYNQHYSESRHL